MKKINRFATKLLTSSLAALIALSSCQMLETINVSAATVNVELTSVTSVKADKNVVTVQFNDGVKAKITFLENNIFRYNVDPTGKFSEYATDNNRVATARIPQYPDSSANYTHPNATVNEDTNSFTITSGDTVITFDKATALMSVSYKGKEVMSESKGLTLGSKTVQSLKKNTNENYYGGGTQNGRFVHTNEQINIANESNWVDGGVASPNPFYYSSNGYGILRNTFLPGLYDFGKSVNDKVLASHDENEYDAYIFLANEANVAQTTRALLQGYYHVTGDPILLPEYAFYEGHLNCYNRDAWSDTGSRGKWEIKGSASATQQDSVPYAQTYYESGQASGFVLGAGQHGESLMGEGPTVHREQFLDTVDTPVKYSAKAVIDQYGQYDMPIGYFLPNDGYGCGYGQNGYYKTGGVKADGSSSLERIAAVDANVDNLKKFTQYAQSKGLETGLWTQSNLTPDSNNETPWHLLRDFEKEVLTGGITTLKTDVAWVGHGYNFALNGIKQAYDIITEKAHKRPNIITLDGWAATQRFGAIWTGDQTGGNWEYIRFHIPTYIGQSLSGNPNIGSDMDGIFGGSDLITTRDTQWKVFTPLMLNMDGWGSYAKTPQTFGDPYTGINRMYLKLKAQLMPYIYTSAASASNIDTGNNDTGMPMVRAMFLEYPEDNYANTKAMQYQYMFGPNVLVAPVYTETAALDAQGNDVRNDIYLPDTNEIWIDYFTGDQYFGGQSLNNYDTPIWKLPVFVKNGSIIPMWHENNNPTQVNKANRIVEFWPEGNTEYTMFEDDGKSATATLKNTEGYGVESTVSYGEHVSTKFTSNVTGSTATLTVNKATGTYEGYDANKNTTFVVNASKNPTSITAKNGNTVLTGVQKNSKDEVLNATLEANQYAYYYDATPQIEYYGVEVEDEFKAMMQDQKTSGKLYVKFATNNQNNNTQTLVLEGFENVDPKLGKNVRNEQLNLPQEYTFTDNVEVKTPTSNTITWPAVDGATSYDVEVDGVINTVLGNETTFTHRDLQYKSTHTYRVRARNANGYSDWSQVQQLTTLDNPWKDTPQPETIIWEGGDGWGKLSNATDHNLESNFHSTGDVVSTKLPMIIDYGKAYELEKFVYYPRSDYERANGDVYRMNLYTSMDGVNWVQQHDGTQVRWTYDAAKKTKNEDFKEIPLTGAARYVKLEILESVGNFFASNELLTYRKENKNGFAVGSTKFNPTVQEADYTNMKNYLGQTGQTFNDQIKAYYGDINNNGIYDVYDYSYTMFNLDGGVQATGNVSGNILLLPSKDTVNAGETFTVSVYADNVANLNAFGQVIHYNIDLVDYVSIEQDPSIRTMEDLTITHKATGVQGHENYINLAYANRGNKVPFTGSGVLATITMKAKDMARTVVNVHDAMELTTVTLIGPRHDTKVVVNDGNVQDPQLQQGTSGNYTYNTDFTMTITNEHKPTDDGTNVSALIQQAEGYAKLFDGSKGREFELKWDIEQNHVSTGQLPAMVTLPLDLHLAVNTPQVVDTIKVYDCAVGGNGYITKASATITYEDKTTSEIAEITADNSDNFAFVFTNPDTSKNVKDITLHFKESKSGPRNLTLAEVEVMSGETKLTKDAFTITLTNKHLTSDDGNNVNKLIQQRNYDGLFNGNTTVGDRSFELKWEVETNFEKALPTYVRIPLTLTATMKDGAKQLDSVSMFNAGTNVSNGWVKEANVVFYYEDNTQSDPVVINNENLLEFNFVNPNSDKKVTKVDLTITKATYGSNSPANSALTLGELEYKFTTQVNPVTDITLGDMKPEIYQGEVMDVVASVMPSDATNPYYTVVSENPEIVQVIKLANDNGQPLYKLHGVHSGSATIKVSALENDQIVKTFTITVKEGVNKTSLENAINTLGKENSKFYTVDSYAKYQLALENANRVYGDITASVTDVNNAVVQLQDAHGKLQETPVTQINGTFTAEGKNSPSNEPGKAVDGNVDTFWESPYFGNDAKLPQTLTVKLDKMYELDKVDVISSKIHNGGILEYTIEVSEDGTTYTPVYSASGINADIYKQGQNVTLGSRFETVKGQYVRLTVTKTVGRIPSEDNVYARVAELKFYGEEYVEPANKTLLEAKITELEAKNLVSTDYTSDTWTAYEQALTNAKNILAKEKATQEEVNNALDALTTAFNGLKKAPVQEVVDKSQLDTYVKEHSNYKKEDYTTYSYNRYVAALNSAKEVLANDSVTQADVNKAYKDLQAAVTGLEKVSVDKPTQPEKPKPTNKPTVKPEPTKKPVANGNGGYDDGGPFTTDVCGNIYDRWGNKIHSAPSCKVSGGYEVPNTGVK